MRRLRALVNQLQQIEDVAAAWEQSRISGADKFLHDLALVYGDGSQPDTVKDVAQAAEIDRLIESTVEAVYGA